MSNTTRISGCTLTLEHYAAIKAQASLNERTVEEMVSHILSDWAKEELVRMRYATMTLERLQDALPFRFELSFRTMNALKKHETMTGAPLDLSDLVDVAEGRVRVRALGVTGLNNLRRALHCYDADCFTAEQLAQHGVFG